MIDLHNHIAFGMDDGSKDLTESKAMIQEALNQGVNSIVLTPHFNPSRNDLEEFITKRDEVASILRNEGLINIKTGAEVFLTSNLRDIDVGRLSFEDSDYILIELSTQIMPLGLESQLLSIMDYGLIPILAHVERYPYLLENPKLMIDLINHGVLFQVNTSTFMDSSKKGLVRACVKHNLIHLVSSDAHNMDRRPMNTGIVMDAIEKEFGSDFVNYLKDNARKVINNEVINVYEPGSLKKLFGKYR